MKVQLDTVKPSRKIASALFGKNGELTRSKERYQAYTKVLASKRLTALKKVMGKIIAHKIFS